MSLTRRRFLAGAAAAGAGLTLRVALGGEDREEALARPMPMRPWGRTGERAEPSRGEEVE